MDLWWDIKRRAREAVFPVLGALALAYFSYHAVQGEHGLLAWIRLNQELGRLETQAALVAAQRAALEHRVALLEPDGLEPDMLDEQVRSKLGYVHPDDMIIFDPGD